MIACTFWGQVPVDWDRIEVDWYFPGKKFHSNFATSKTKKDV